jgi:hypothetical protein
LHEPELRLGDSPKKLILAAALGDCVHVAGLLGFLATAESEGWRAQFLGPAVPISRLVDAIDHEHPDLLAVSYRLTEDAAARLFSELDRELGRRNLKGLRMVFGGTAPVCRRAEESGLFEACFGADSGQDTVRAYLRGSGPKARPGTYPGTLLERLEVAQPFPLIRHHFGQATLEATVTGIEQLAEAQALDIISLGPDQNAQRCFFRPGEMDVLQDGAGGVPVRQPEDFVRLYQASRRGNFPLMRCYSGTRDILKLAEVLLETIGNAWSAVPLCWYSELDGRSDRPLREAITENLSVVRWHGTRGVPVEINEAHHWSLREAHDTIAVVMAYLAAYNAKAAGVRHYVAQYMFNTPAGTAFTMDLGKMLAKVAMIEQLHDGGFRALRQVRTGLASMPADYARAKGQLGSSTMLQMALNPHIVHIVGFSEADHAATPDDILQSAGLVRQVIANCMGGTPDMTRDPAVLARRDELVEEAAVLLDGIRQLAPEGTPDPFTDPVTLERAIGTGLLDAPHLRGHRVARGTLKTQIIDGACRAIDPTTGRPLSERERVGQVLAGANPHWV